MPITSGRSARDDVPAQAEDITRDFRRIMRGMAQSVSLVTTSDQEGNPYGMAASAVISVSMDPPSMCVAVNRSASIHPILATSKSFCVNLLRAGQTDLVSAFSRADRRHMRFASGTWLWAHGLPYLESALGAVFCESRASVDFGTHTLHVGAVIGLADLGTGSPLVWHDGGYACLNRAAN